MFKPEFGNVPSWIGAVSVLLAFRIFLRDRGNLERKQVDQLGIWCEPVYERRMPHEAPRTEEGELHWSMRNASDQPLRIEYMAFGVLTKWLVQDGPMIDVNVAGLPQQVPRGWTLRPGTDVTRYFWGPCLLAPGTKDFMTKVNVLCQAPERADQLDPFNGIDYAIAWVLVLDNAGRRWEVRPGVVGRARRITWRSRRRAYYPVEWQHPFTRRIRVGFYGSKSAVIRTRQRLVAWAAEYERSRRGASRRVGP